MRIDTSKPRKRLFKNPSANEICRQYSNKDRVMIKDLKGEVLTKEGSLDGLKDGSYTIDDHLTITRLKTSPDLCILPDQYRINRGQAHHAIAYSLDTLLLLDSMALKRELITGKVPKNPLSKKQKRIHHWSPEQVIPQKIAMTEMGDYSCLAWWGSDRHRRILSFYRSVQGAELYAFNDLARLKLDIPKTKKQLKTKIVDNREITPHEINQKRRWLEETMQYIKEHQLYAKLEKLDVDFTDYIEIGRPFAQHTGQNARVPSRSDPPRVYPEKLTGTLITESQDPFIYSEAWEIRGRCPCPDKGFRSDRRKKKGEGQDEDFFCAHEISSLLAVYNSYRTEPERLFSLPLFVPTKETINFVDKLRYETIMLEHKDDKLQKRSLNNTEMENLLIKKFIIDGFDACADFDYSQDMKINLLYLT
ncbi:MAG: hypothetical protein ACQESG_03270 [Nanobdellota archaeon]